MPWLEAVCVARAVIVLEPDVNVVPLTVTAYPLAALVVTPTWDVPMPVLEVVNVPKATLVPVAPAQLLLVMPEVPVQKVRASSTEPLTVIWLAVLAATVPLSIEVVQAESEYVVILAKKVVLVAVGLTIPVNWMLTLVGVPVLELLAIRSRPFVENVPVQLPPEPIPLIVPTEAPVVSRPDGTPVGVTGLHEPDAVVQISTLTDLMVVEAATVKSKV